MQNPLELRPLGPRMVSSVGLGCMNLSHAYGVPPQPAAAARILGARYNAATQAEIDTEDFA